MFIDKKMSNRSFVPTNIISLLLLGIVSLVLWEFTRSSSPVSYTHLDVYKRQGEGISFRRPVGWVHGTV